VALALVLALTESAHAGDEAATSTAAPDHLYRAELLLDPAVGIEVQLAQMAQVEREAKAGDARAQYLLGTLYRLGKRHPAALLERDDDKASIYLSNAATSGQVLAIAGMAELELRRQRGMEAMVWAQAFALYQKDEPRDPRVTRPDNQAYAAYLLQRCYDKIGRGDEAQQQLVDAFVAFQANHDAKIRSGLGLARIEGITGAPLQLVSAPERPLGTPSATEERMKTPGIALFLLGVDAKGAVQRRLVVDSLPDQVFAEGLTRVADRLRFNPIDGMTELRWGITPIAFDNLKIGIKHKKKK
jgi:hypothetical protein